MMKNLVILALAAALVGFVAYENPVKTANAICGDSFGDGDCRMKVLRVVAPNCNLSNLGSPSDGYIFAILLKPGCRKIFGGIISQL